MKISNIHVGYRLTSLFFILLCSQVVCAQNYFFDIEVINVEDGLPHRRAFNIVQDKEGFIWVSTLGAISRYDGHSFKTYTHTILETRENVSPYIASDAQNRIWYCGNVPLNGIHDHGGVISSQRDSIYSLENISEGRFLVKDIIQLHNFKTNTKAICIITRQGMVYKYEKGHFEEIYHFPKPPLPRLYCEMTSDGGYWITHSAEAIKVKDKKLVKTVQLNDSSFHISQIITTTPDLIVEINKPGSTVYRKLENDSFMPFTIADQTANAMKRLIKQHNDYTVYASKDALVIRDHQGKLLHKFDDFDPSGFNSKLKQNDNFTDRQGILWIGTDNGLFKINARENPFETLQPGNSIRGIYRDGDSLWTGGYYGNYRADIKAEKAIQYGQDFNAAISFYKDKEEHFWVVFGNGLQKYNLRTGRYTVYNFAQNTPFRLLFQNPLTNNYWAGTDNGLFRFYKKDGSTSLFALPVVSKDLHIRQFYQNLEGIWVVSNKGLFLLDAKKETLIKHYTVKDGLPESNLNHLYEDAQGVFWLGTKGSGLLRWERSNNTFIQYTREDGLSDNTIYAIYEDDYQTLWLPGNNGLMAFDKTTQTTKVYLPQNGIAHKEFNTFSHFQDKDGTLYFGGLNGITRFHPAALREKSGESPPLYATRVRVLEKDTETFTDKTEVYTKSRKISLNPGDRILEVELTLLDYEKSSENQYAYKLSGIQEQWIYTGENKLSIISPPYGRYNLVVKARGVSGTWSEDLLTIPMHIKLPFYRQWWFILASVLMAIAVIIISVRWRIRKLQQDRQRLEAEVQKRTHKIEEQAEALKTLDKAKTQFFSNITHEFRTPLTLVKGPIEQMIAQPPPPTTLKKRLKRILKNTDNLLELINQLLDISKLESGKMRVEVSHGDVISYTRELIAQFQPLAAEKKIQLNFTTHANAWETHFDSDKWTKIMYNLLSNAFKFTHEGDRVMVDLRQTQQTHQEWMQLTVKDTGIGIQSGQMSHIFDRFYQVDASATRQTGGTGIGLALVKELVELQNGAISVSSTPGKGATFTLSLPVLPTPAETNGISYPEEAEVVLPFMASPESPTENSLKTLKDQNKTEKMELLIVEDHPEMRAYIRSCIDTSVYNIAEARDGQEGIAIAQETIPDLIISDVMMPKKDGFELTHAIRDHLATSHIPLILLTAKASLESRLKGLERGADAYLTKPFSPDELALRIQKLIELRRSLRERYQNNRLPEENEALQKNKAFQKEDSFISRLTSYILENISDPDLDVEHVCHHFAMSSRQFYRKLKALKNTSIASFIRTVRMEKAMQLLKENSLSISEIAYTTGFSSLSHFSRVFKKVHGKAPSHYQ